jgi:hypothetical protein
LPLDTRQNCGCGKLLHKEMKQRIKLFDVVALAKNLPKHKLRCGQVGTVVELLDSSVFEVEFTDNAGRAYASLALKENQLLVLRYQPQAVGSESQFPSSEKDDKC